MHTKEYHGIVIPHTRCSRLFGAAILTAACALAWQTKQEEGPARAYSIPPDISNARYGPHQRNVIDVWKARNARPAPVVIFIHGGGFTQGDKSNLSDLLLKDCLQKGFAVASINYRYSTIAPYPAPMADGARAVQYVRLHAKEWNIDPKAVACTGGSAGAGISLWIGFHDDMADPASDDPVKRQSTRLSVIGVTNAQVSYDPRFIARLISEDTGRHPALAMLFGVPKGRDVMTAADKFALYEDGAPITHLNAGDPPVFMFYSRDLHLPPANLGEGIHSPKFGLYLKQRMDKLGIECVVRTLKDYPAGKAAVESNRDMVEFFAKYFPKN